MGEEKSESRGTNYGGTGFTTHRTQNEAVGGNICCHAYPCGRSQPTGHQLWGEREPGEGGGDCQQELRAAEFASNPAASEPAAVLLHPPAAAVSSEPATHTRG